MTDDAAAERDGVLPARYRRMSADLVRPLSPLVLPDSLGILLLQLAEGQEDVLLNLALQIQLI